MASVSGKAGVVTVGGTTVLKVTAWEATPTCDVLDDTGMSDAGVGAYLAGITRWTCRFDVHFQTTQTPYVTLALTAGTSVAVVLKTDATPSQQLSGTVIISSIPMRSEVAGLVTWSLEGQGTGALTLA